MVGAPDLALDETWRDFARDLGILDRLAAHDAFGDHSEERRADKRDFAAGGVIAHQGMGIIARHGAAGRQHADQARS